MTLLTSKEIKSVLKISDCELMHKRQRSELAYEKKGNAYLYSLPDSNSLLDHPIGQQLLYWHRDKHRLEIENTPNAASKQVLELLVWNILLPIERRFSRPTITYGFTSSALKKVIEKKHASGTAPTLDQHAALETNKSEKLICNRAGAACDFVVNGFSSAAVAQFVVAHLDYDRIYYYGKDKPLHVSVNADNPAKHFQIMAQSKNGRRYPSKKAFGQKAIELAEEL